MWKDLIVFDIKPGLYKISDAGEIWSNYSNNYMKQQIGWNGYRTINLMTNDGRAVFMVHKLVLATFQMCHLVGKDIGNHKDINNKDIAKIMNLDIDLNNRKEYDKFTHFIRRIKNKKTYTHISNKYF